MTTDRAILRISTLHHRPLQYTHARVAWAVAEDETEEERDGFQIFERREGAGVIDLSSPAM